MNYVNMGTIPQELKDCRQWVLWKLEPRRPGDEPTKVPYQATGAKADANNPETWTDFETVNRRYAAGNWTGIGFEFASPYLGIDLDRCREPDTGKVYEWAREIILQLDSYAEVSPSKTGVKIWVKAKFPRETGGAVNLPDYDHSTDKPARIEIYDHGRFFAMTGEVLKGMREIRERQDVIDALYKRFWGNVPEYTKDYQTEWRSESAVLDRAWKYLDKMERSVSGQDGHGRAFAAACAMVCGFDLSINDAMGVMREWNQGCQPPWSEYELKHKVDDAARQNCSRGYLRNARPERYNQTPTPEFKMTSNQDVRGKNEPPKRDIKITSLADATAKYFTRLKSGKIILRELGLPDLDYAIGGGIEDGEMIIMAGRPSHAKTMGAQQITYHFTANGIPVAFFSEETTDLILGKRAIQFATTQHSDNWARCVDDVEADVEKFLKNKAPMHIVEGCREASRIAYEIKRMKQSNGIGLAVVDYAQLLQAPGRGRMEIITNVSIALKQAALENEIPVIVLCQLNRSIENRDEFIPRISDLKDAGQLEQDADVIIFQVWPFKVDPEKFANDRDKYLMYIGKNKNRPTNQACVECDIKPGRQMLVMRGAVLSEQPPRYDGSILNVFDGEEDTSGFDLNFGP